jgi:hypothetical protein
MQLLILIQRDSMRPILVTGTSRCGCPRYADSRYPLSSRAANMSNPPTKLSSTKNIDGG